MHDKPKEFIQALVNKWGAKRKTPTIRLHSNGGSLSKSFWQNIGSVGIACAIGIDGVTNGQHQL